MLPSNEIWINLLNHFLNYEIQFIFLMLAFISSSCIVTKKKFDDALAQKVKTEAELNDKTAKLEKPTET